MRTLIITSTIDATVDLLINDIGSHKFVRLNYDRPFDWQIKFGRENIEFQSEKLDVRIPEAEIKKCIWRKPFQLEPTAEPYDDQYYKSEWKYFLYDIFFYFHEKNKTKLNPPLPDYLFTKNIQARLANGLFELPRSETTINLQPSTSSPTIAKSLSGKPFSDGNILYTIDVENRKLDTNIWNIQEKIKKPYDLTVAYLYGQCFAYQLERSKFSGIDWRMDMHNHGNEWEHIKLDPSIERNIILFMNKSNLNYGRFDFLADKNGRNPVFLEVNRNGQWAWLDREEITGLFSAMKKIYDPEEI